MLLDDLSDLLSTGGLTTAIYKDHIPALAGDAAIGLFETGGMSSLQTMSTGPGAASTIERPRVQIIVRHRDASVAMAVATQAYTLIDGLRERAINGVRYLWAQAVQSPFYLDTDENNRILIAFNVDVLKALSTSTST